MKSNIVEFSYRKGSWNSYPNNLLNETDWHKFLHKTISSEENPPESPSESSRRLLQVQWDPSFTITLGNNLKFMDTKVTKSNKYNWGNSLQSDLRARAE